MEGVETGPVSVFCRLTSYKAVPILTQATKMYQDNSTIGSAWYSGRLTRPGTKKTLQIVIPKPRPKGQLGDSQVKRLKD